MKLLLLALMLAPLALQAEKCVDSRFIFLTTALVASQVADNMATHSCLDRRTCHERGYLITGDKKVDYLTTSMVSFSYSLMGCYLRWRDSAIWWIPQVALTSTRTFGFAWAMRF